MAAMAGFLRFACACAALPLAWGVTRSCLDVVIRIPAADDAILPPGLVAVLAGFLSHLLMWVLVSAPVRVYVLGHELTHVLWGALFGARASHLKVGRKGGSVTLTKTNVWITLAPYFFPFYTMVVVLLAGLVRCFVSPLPGSCAWLFAVGFTWGFHCCFTVWSLTQRQPDIEEYGHLFSYVLIWIFNVLGIAAGIVCTTEIPWSLLGRRLLVRTCAVYGTVGEALEWIYESLRTLPILQG